MAADPLRPGALVDGTPRGEDVADRPARHPSDATLAAYAGGTLGELPAYVAAAHLAGCRRCRRTARIAEAVGGVLLEDLPPAELAPDALRRVLDRLNRPDAPPDAGKGHRSAVAGAGSAPPGLPGLPAALSGLHVPPFRWVAPGVHWAGILRRKDGLLGLLRVRPGTALPLHSHTGQEMTLVLEGAYDGPDGRFGPGDFEEADKDVAHDQAAVGPGDCICLVATTGRLRFRTPLSRLWQPFMPF